ncbi:molybdate ABC transporter substrate-binding protein [Aliikangiella sp. IMCC44653]
MRVKRHCLLFACCIIFSLSGRTAELKVAVASNFINTAEALVEAYHQRTGQSVVLVPGSSGKLYAQISHGAPFDLFLSADSEKPAALINLGLAEPNSLFIYAIGRLALWSTEPQYIPVTGLTLHSNFEGKIVIANPNLAPYGVAAQQVLEKLGAFTSLQNALIRVENVGQAFWIVNTGNASLGFVAWSQLLQQEQSPQHYWLVPETMHDPINQQAVVISASRNRAQAQDFANFIQSKYSRELIISHGYGLESNH